jgi:PST family polysaccharide transporter
MVAGTPIAEAAGATLRQRAVRGGACVLAARLVAQAFQWAVTLSVARLLLPDDYGMMTSGTLFLGLADLLVEAGVNRALVQKQQLKAADLAEGFTLSLILSVGLYAVLFLLAGPAADYLERPDFVLFLRVLALLLLLVPWRTVTGALLEHDLQLGKCSAIQLAGAVLQSVLVLGLAVAGLGYWALAGGALAGRCLETFMLGYATGWSPRLARPGLAAAGLLRFGMHVSAGSLLWFAYSNADFAVAGALLGPIALGYYAVAFQLISLPVQKLTAAANQVMYPVYCRLQEDPQRLRDWFLRLTVLQNFLALPALAGMALVAADGIPLLLGEQWRPAVRPFQLLCPVGVLMVVGCGIPPLLVALGRPDLNLRYTAVCTVVYPISFLAAGWWGTQLGQEQGGLIGICLVWLGLYPLMLSVLIHSTRRLTGVTPLAVLHCHVPVLAGVAVMAGCVLTVQQFLFTAPATARLVVAIATGAMTYAVWMLLATRDTVLADIARLWRELRSGG